jgi:hypothetical protein
MIKLAAAFAVVSISTVGFSQTADSDLTPRQIFDMGIKAPAPTVKPATPGPKPTSGGRTRPAETRPTEARTAETPKPPERQTGLSNIQQVSYTPLAVRYSILQEKAGRFVSVDPQTEFHSGDRIRVRVESNDAGYLYIVMHGSSGQWKVLFPRKDIHDGNNVVAKGQPYTIPPEGDPAFRFDETAGEEKLSLVLSRSPEQDLEKLIYAVGDPTRSNDHRTMMAQANPIDDAIVGRMRDRMVSRDLQFEKYEGPAQDGKSETTTYAATKDKSPDAWLFVDLKFTHK